MPFYVVLFCFDWMLLQLQLPLDTKVPPDWVKVNSTKKAIRYHPPEVLVALDELALANEQLTVVCQAAWNKFLTSFGGYFAEFQAAVQALASLDCLNSLAILSRNKVKYYVFTLSASTCFIGCKWCFIICSRIMSVHFL